MSNEVELFFLLDFFLAILHNLFFSTPTRCPAPGGSHPRHSPLHRCWWLPSLFLQPSHLFQKGRSMSLTAKWTQVSHGLLKLHMSKLSSSPFSLTSAASVILVLLGGITIHHNSHDSKPGSHLQHQINDKVSILSYSCRPQNPPQLSAWKQQHQLLFREVRAVEHICHLSRLPWWFSGLSRS